MGVDPRRRLRYTDGMIAEKIRHHRRRLGWQQRDLAREAGLSTSTVGNIEANQHLPQKATLGSIARALGVTVEDLTG